jgi:hypothetical protein
MMDWPRFRAGASPAAVAKFVALAVRVSFATGVQ